jgi:serine/threonine-protein kinase HipA
MNPNPFETEHTLTLDGRSAAPDMATIIKTAELYRLDRSKAEKIVDKLKATTSKWRRLAEQLGCPREEAVRMQGVFQK